MFVLDAAGRKRAWPLRLLRRPRRSKSTEKMCHDRRPIGRAMLKAPDPADRRCRGQRIISPAAASSPSLAPMYYRSSIPKVRARFGTTSTVCLPTIPQQQEDPGTGRPAGRKYKVRVDKEFCSHNCVVKHLYHKKKRARERQNADPTLTLTQTQYPAIATSTEQDASSSSPRTAGPSPTSCGRTPCSCARERVWTSCCMSPILDYGWRTATLPSTSKAG